MERSASEVYRAERIIENSQTARKVALEKMVGYHRQGLVETKMHCIKLLGDKLTAKSFQSQVNEIHARVAVLNKFRTVPKYQNYF